MAEMYESISGIKKLPFITNKSFPHSLNKHQQQQQQQEASKSKREFIQN